MQAKLVFVGLMAFGLLGCGRQAPVAARSLPQVALGVKQASASFLPGRVRFDAPYLMDVHLGAGGEAWLNVVLHAPDADWGSPGREAAALSLWVDGKAQQDVLVPGGAARAQRVFLGALAPGAHQLRLVLHPKSNPQAGEVEVGGGSLGVLAPSDPGYEVMAHAPVVGSRDDVLRTDMPLAMYHELLPQSDGSRRIRYTAIISNEDSGTDTKALFARWGRAVDIDWCYEVHLGADGRRLGATYQGLLHWTRDYGGPLEGQHPFLRISTANNTYTDGVGGAFRLRMDPSLGLNAAQAPRESLLDRLPWSYALMAQELRRENKVKAEEWGAGPQAQAGPEVGDPRRFLFVDLKLKHGGRHVAVGVQLKGDARWWRSDRLDGGLAVNRGGWVRTAVELPRRPNLDDVAQLVLWGAGGKNSTEVEALGQVMSLNEQHQPVHWPVSWQGPGSLAREGAMLRFFASADSGALPEPASP